VINRASGTELVDVDGNRLLDFMNNATTLIHGHRFGPVEEVVREQVAKGTAWGALNEHQIALAEILCSRVASVERVRFANSGTEATMMALRAARAATGKSHFVKVEGGYHGTHDAVSISVSPGVGGAGSEQRPQSKPDGAGIPDYAREAMHVVPFNDEQALAETVANHRDTIAAVIVEPLLGSHGYTTATPPYLEAVRRITEEHGVLLVLDEVQTFRLDQGGAQALYGIRPDLTAFAKIIGGGFPVGAFGGRADLMSRYAPDSKESIGHGGTFNGNPVTMAAGAAAMEHLTADRIAYINELGDRLRTGMGEVLVEQGLQGRIVGHGSLVGIHMTDRQVRNYRDAGSAPAEVRRFIFLACLNRGLMMSTGGCLNTTTAMTRETVDEAIGIFQEALIEAYPFIESGFPQLLR
jgi:glutamate-1-semialdehyde 2,1-aminomutase